MFHRIMLATDAPPASDEAARAVVSLAILNRLFLGSVADRVVRLAPCHVLTVKSAA